MTSIRDSTTENLHSLLKAEADALTAQEQQELIDAVLSAEEAYANAPTQEVAELDAEQECCCALCYYDITP